MITPAPMFTPSPTVASPIYARWLALLPRPRRDFLSSTKLPTRAAVPTCDFGRRWQKGPSWASASTTESVSTQYGLRVTRSPRRLPLTWQPAPTTHSAPMAVAPSRTAPGRSEEHTSELQSQFHLVCRLLLEKKKKKTQFFSLYIKKQNKQTK